LVDIARAPKKKTSRNVMIAGGVVALILVTVALGRLRPAAPSVEVATLIIDSVRRGDINIEVRGPGNLVPEHIRFITAQASARVDRLIVQSGASVPAGAVLLTLSNPDVEIAALQAEEAYNRARNDLFAMRTNLNGARLTQEGVVATTHTNYISAKQEEIAAESLIAKKLISEFDANRLRAAAAEYETRWRVEKERLQLMTSSVDSQIEVQTTQVARLKSIAQLDRNRVDNLQVRAPDAGIVQDLTIQLGQWVTEGTTLAKVVQPGTLKAVIRIPETQAKDVQLGQAAEIDTRNGVVHGKVSRKDPSSVNGTVTVDVKMEGELPPGAVPDLSVDGTIKIAELKNVLYTGRPAYGSGTGMVGLFKLMEQGSEASRVQVALGRSSVTTVEILRGLNVGDRVILSDMSQYDNVERVRLK
jgi:multidrug efflux pump subunit AcrA (membrane-fusion protein)